MGYNKESRRPSEKLLDVLAPSGRAIGRVIVAGLVGVILAASPINASAEEAIQAVAASNDDAIVEVVDVQEGSLDETLDAQIIAETDIDEQAVDDQAPAEQDALVQEVAESAADTQEEGAAAEETLADDANQTGALSDDVTTPATDEEQAAEPEVEAAEEGELAEVANDTAAAADDTLAAQNEAAVEPVTAAKKGSWVVDARSGRLERYWVWDDGTLAKNTLITPDNGAGYYAWALSDGRILRGKWDSGSGRVYIADNAGKLIGSDMDSDGWVVTNIYDGRLQRYYVDANLKAACSGFFSVKDYGDVFGMGGHGFVVRDDFMFGNRKWSANNDGKLRSGWYVTSGFGDGLQRYWMGDTVFGSPHAAAVSRLVTASKDKSGYDAYATADGYVLRGRWDAGNGRVYIADNDGKLIGSGMTKSGWVVTKKYDGVWERYYVDAVTKAACSGFFTVDGYGDVFGMAGTGKILRGALRFGKSVILGDNDGRLPQTAGWLVTSAYGQGIQRYWIEKVYGKYMGTKPGYSTAGYAHYTTDDGYVLRNAVYIAGVGKGYTADNDGRAKQMPIGWSRFAGHWYYLSATQLGKFDIDVNESGKLLGHYDILHDIWERIKDYRSDTQYLVATSWDSCYLAVFKGARYNWEPIFGWNCVTGNMNKVVTPDGGTWAATYDYYLARYNVPSMRSDEVEGWAWGLNQSFSGSRLRMVNVQEQYFTSIFYTLGYHTWLNSSSELGKHLSYGCVRLDYPNAKWIYENIAPGTRCLQIRTPTYR